MPGFPNTHPHGPGRPERERSNEDLCVRRRGAEYAGERNGGWSGGVRTREEKDGGGHGEKGIKSFESVCLSGCGLTPQWFGCTPCLLQRPITSSWPPHSSAPRSDTDTRLPSRGKTHLQSCQPRRNMVKKDNIFALHEYLG